jgi:HSP20 family protein
MEVQDMLMRTDPFRDLDRLTQQVRGTTARPALMAMDAWRAADHFVVEFDLPGVDPGSIDLNVESNVLTLKAHRSARQGNEELIAAERPQGVFSRQLILGDSLDTEHVSASYRAGVLRLEIPVAQQSKPRKVTVTTAPEHNAVTDGRGRDETTGDPGGTSGDHADASHDKESVDA